MLRLRRRIASRFSDSAQHDSGSDWFELATFARVATCDSRLHPRFTITRISSSEVMGTVFSFGSWNDLENYTLIGSAA